MSLHMPQQRCGGLRRHSNWSGPSCQPIMHHHARSTECHAISPAQRDVTRPKLFQQDPQDLSADDEDGFLLDPLDDRTLHGVTLLHDPSSLYQPALTTADDDEQLTTTIEDEEEASDARLSSIMSTALTQEELEVIQRHLTQGPGDRSRDEGSAEEEAEGADTSQFPPDFWATDRERVFLVGVDILGRKFENQNNARNSNSNTWANGNGKGGKSESSGAGGSAALRKRRAPVKYSVHDSLEELARLADTAGLKVVGSTYQALETPNNSTYIGSGKVAEVARAMRAYKAETVMFDCELTPGQLRQLEKALSGENGEVRVGDRTALILDIFNQRAATREGKLQVELAQTEYQLPRLTRMWTHLDRVGGGGQVKGTGEKQIETDKRILRDRAAALRKELEAVRGHRRAYRERRAVAPIPVVALVGYTNAGKSTLLNRLTDAGVLAEDKLFATLDPTTRKIRTKGNRELLVTDTVGFIQKLPTELVAAFRATLEEVQDASVLLHLVDISHPNAAAQCEAVLQVLDDLGVADIPLVTAWNKLDACPDPAQVRAVAARRKDTVCVSGQTGDGVDTLLALITEKLSASMTEVQVCLPYAAGDLLDEIHKAGELLDPAEYTDAGINVRARVPAPLVGRLAAYSVLPAAPPAAPAPKLLDVWDGAEAELHMPLALGVGTMSVDCSMLDCTQLW